MSTRKPHTTLPWAFEIDGSQPTGRIIDATGKRVIAYGTSRSDTRFIVRACNAHYQLVRALRWLVEVVTTLKAPLPTVPAPSHASSRSRQAQKAARKGGAS